MLLVIKNGVQHGAVYYPYRLLFPVWMGDFPKNCACMPVKFRYDHFEILITDKIRYNIVTHLN